jgi:hypothetical protein
MSKFDSIPVNAYFKTSDGEQLKKISAQVYADSLTGIESYWDPIFDTKITEWKQTTKTSGSPEEKFSVDPQTRVVTPNPKYKSAEKALAELWGSALFDCGPEDYEFMVTQCIKWGNSRKKARKAGVIVPDKA